MTMTEPENHTLRLLREIRAAIKTMGTKIDGNHQEIKEQIDSLKRFTMGESVLGRYATAEFDERLEAIEKRVAALEQGR
jgi:polyhydroxyalkanoate synthesis regulator phasin